jgi:hypothetical protein
MNEAGNLLAARIIADRLVAMGALQGAVPTAVAR